MTYKVRCNYEEWLWILPPLILIQIQVTDQGPYKVQPSLWSFLQPLQPTAVSLSSTL